MPWTCFWLEPVQLVRLELRRYATGDCPATGGDFHDARVRLRDLRRVVPDRTKPERPAPPVENYADHPLWPDACPCGYRFGKRDNRQTRTERLYRGVPEGGLVTLREAPPGSMWDAWWLPDAYRGPDGFALAVSLPPGGGLDYWLVDGPSSSGGRWTRTGKVPKVTVTPSILTPTYHGHLQGGVLTDPL